MSTKNLHFYLDFEYGPDGDATLLKHLNNGINPNERFGEFSETLLHVAARRYRTNACKILVQHGAEINAKTKGGKTAYAHCIRRGFDDLARALNSLGAHTDLNDADEFAVAVTHGQLDKAKTMLASNPDLARTGNPEEDRLLADVAGRFPTEPVILLIQAGANLDAPALDDGTPLHQTAWFGQPQNARLLIDAGASLNIFDKVHESAPIGWVSHGSRYSGDAENRQEVYVQLARMLLEAGCDLHYPDEPDSTNYFERIYKDATPAVREVLDKYRPSS